VIHELHLFVKSGFLTAAGLAEARVQRPNQPHSTWITLQFRVHLVWDVTHAQMRLGVGEAEGAAPAAVTESVFVGAEPAPFVVREKAAGGPAEFFPMLMSTLWN
jgi:hypothetical protein